jgi:cysteine desulfurase
LTLAEEQEAPEYAYLDYNATAPLRPEALEAVAASLRSVGNASSIHAAGRDAASRVDLARTQLAGLLGCAPGEIVFTSGATEANNLALRAASSGGGTVITTLVEHPAVLESARAAVGPPGRLVLLPVDRDGRPDLEPLARACRDDGVALVSAMLANNETGVLTDIASVAKLAREAGALVHTDATQYVGRLPLDLAELDVDLLSLSGHKFGGPQGVGALFIRRGAPLPLRPLLAGGGQERGWRAGTLNVAGIVGLGAAAEAAKVRMRAEIPRVRALRDMLEEGLMSRLPGCRINSAGVPRLPGVTSVTIPGVPADAVLAAMPEIAASDGSACASGALTPSHVLLAMGRSREEAESTIRFSCGFATTSEEIRRALDATLRAVSEVSSALESNGHL